MPEPPIIADIHFTATTEEMQQKTRKSEGALACSPHRPLLPCLKCEGGEGNAAADFGRGGEGICLQIWVGEREERVP